MTTKSSSESSGLLRVVITGTGISGIGKIIKSGLGFLFQVLLGNLLGPAGYGVFTVGTSTVSILQKFSSFGLSNGLVRLVSTYSADDDFSRIRGLLITAYSTSLFFATIIATILFLAAKPIASNFLGQAELSNVVRLFALAIPLRVGLGLTKAVIQAVKQVARHTLLNIFENALRLLLVVGVLFFGYGIETAVTAYVASVLCTGIVGLSLLYIEFSDDLFAINSEFDFKRIFHFSLPLYLAGLSFLLMTRVDVFVIQFVQDASNVGEYRSAITLAALVSLPLSSLNTIFAPVVSELYDDNQISEMENVFEVSTRWASAATLLAALLLLLFRIELLEIWGPSYIVAAGALIGLTIGQSMNAITGPVGYVLQMSDNQYYVLVNNVFTVVLNLLLNVILVPRYGILGAGIATAVAISTNNLLGVIEVKVLLGIDPWSINQLRLILPILGGATSYILIPSGLVWWPITAAIVSICFIVTFGLTGIPKDEGTMIMSRISQK